MGFKARHAADVNTTNTDLTVCGDRLQGSEGGGHTGEIGTAVLVGSFLFLAVIVW